MLNSTINYQKNKHNINCFPYSDKPRINFPKYTSRKKLYRDAVDSYNKFNVENKLNLNNLIFDKKDFLNRIALNYLRHNCDYYNECIENKPENYEELKAMVNNAIYEEYPFLKPIEFLYH